jgi:hypothetical protein
MPVHAAIVQWMFEQKDEQGGTLPPTWLDVSRADIEAKFNLAPEEYALLITDLERLQIIEPRRDIKSPRDPSTERILSLVVARLNSRVKYESIGFTPLGLQFIMACTPPGQS